MACESLLILADIDLIAIIQVLLVLGFLVVPVLLRIWNAAIGAGKQAPQREVVVQGGEPSMESQIEDFLRRATDQSHDAPVRQPAELEVEYAEPVYAEPVEADLSDAVVHERISSHVEHALEQHVHDAFDHNLGSLHATANEDDAGAEVPTHSEDHIDHFAPANARQTEQTTDVQDVTSMLRDSHNLRTAIILNEIFKPVSSRW